MNALLRAIATWLLPWLLASAVASAASPELRGAAEAGDLRSQLRLAHELLGEQRFDDALRFLEMAEKQGSVEATRALAVLYAGTHPTRKDVKKAIGLFAKAADRGDTASQFVLATYFDRGDVVARNPSEALRWLRLSARGGYGPAQVRLAELYENGVPGVLQKNLVDAFVLYRKALDTAMDEAASFMAPGEVLSRIERLKRSLTESELRQAMNHRKDPLSDLLPRFRPDRRQFMSNGSGFLITQDGYLVTNHHVVEGSSGFSIKSVHGIHDGVVVDVDAANDLALMKIGGDFTPVSVMNSDLHAKPGMRVFVYGYPAASHGASSLGQEEPKFADGAIGAAEFVAGLGDKGRDLSITVPLIGGNSGGGLFDFRGNVLGVAVSTLGRKAGMASINNAVKSSRLLRFLDKHPKVKAALAPPVLVERRPEEVVAEVRQSVVLVGGYLTAHEFALGQLDDQRRLVQIALFRKATGNQEPVDAWDEATFKQFREYAAKYPSRDLAELLASQILNLVQNAEWTEAESKDVVQRLLRENRL